MSYDNYNAMLHCWENYQTEIIEELLIMQRYISVRKDILLVVHNQFEWVKRCIDSIRASTDNYDLYIWDNGSDEPTKSYLQSLSAHVIRSEKNEGFITPNNELAKLGTSPYLILLNSDTEVQEGWDKALIAWLQQKPDVAATSYLGGRVDGDFYGKHFGWGEQLDYLCGWCLCISRETYNEFGLFDADNLKFAYGEDADLSFRLKSAGKHIRALHLNLVAHFENKTVTNLNVESQTTLQQAFTQNHQYLRSRWKNLIAIR